MSTSTKQPRSRFKNFLSSAFNCFTGPRSKAYHPISDHSSSVQITPTSSRQFDPAQITPTFPDQPVPSPTKSSSQRCSTEAPHKVVAQTKPPTSVDPEFDLIDRTYLCRMTRYPDGGERWLPDIKLGPNQAFRACVDPTFGNCLTFLPPSQNPPTLESACELDPNKNGMCFEENDTQYWIIGPDIEKDRTLKFPFAFITNAEVNVKGLHGIHVSHTQNGSEVAPDTHGSTDCPSTSLARSEPPSTCRSKVKVLPYVNELSGARGKMRKSGGKWKERPKRQ
jgi:hypothetical protein